MTKDTTNLSMPTQPDQDLFSIEKRAELALHHPLFTGEAILETSSIYELYGAVMRATALRETGGCFTGAGGVGKSYAIRKVASLVSARMPNLCVLIHNAHNKQIPSIRAFFKHFLSTVGHLEGSGETFDLRMRLINALIDRARMSGLNVVLLLLDEAQAMTLEDLLFLKDVFNELDLQGIRLVTILMGQEPNFTAFTSRLRQGSRLDLVGRFLMRKIPFRPLSSVEDLEDILGQIDNEVYPAGSCCTWTMFFFPLAYQNGFRMRHQANTLYQVMKKMVPNKCSKEIFPARQVFSAIRSFMHDNASRDSHTMSLSTPEWRKAVEYALVEEAIKLASDTRTSDMLKVTA